jgi:hypothetical protein
MIELRVRAVGCLHGCTCVRGTSLGHVRTGLQGAAQPRGSLIYLFARVVARRH